MFLLCVKGYCNWNDYDAAAKFPFVWPDLKGERGTFGVVSLQFPPSFPPQQFALAGIWAENWRLKHWNSGHGRHLRRTIHPYYVLFGQKHTKLSHRMLHSRQFLRDFLQYYGAAARMWVHSFAPFNFDVLLHPILNPYRDPRT